MDLTESIPIFTCGSTHVGELRWLTRSSSCSLTGPEPKLDIHWTLESWVCVYLAVQSVHVIDHTSLLLYSSAPHRAGEARGEPGSLWHHCAAARGDHEDRVLFGAHPSSLCVWQEHPFYTRSSSWCAP